MTTTSTTNSTRQRASSSSSRGSSHSRRRGHRTTVSNKSDCPLDFKVDQQQKVRLVPQKSWEARQELNDIRHAYEAEIAKKDVALKESEKKLVELELELDELMVAEILFIGDVQV